MKMRRPHLVPLSHQAVAALKELRGMAGDSQFLPPAPTKLGVISENTLLFALYRMGYAIVASSHHAVAVQEQLKRGGLVLWVNVRDAREEKTALDVLREHSAHDVHVHDIAQ